MTMSDKIGIFSFFSGAGFLDLGFEKTGHYDVLFVNEYHKAFVEVYKASRKKMGISEPIFGYQNADISENLSNINSIWFSETLKKARQSHKLIGFIGGPPCPDFSIAGKNKGKTGENGKLSGTYVELICSAQPDFFLFENVKGLYRTKKHKAFFNHLKLKLVKAGYYLTEKLINAIEFGAPQDRERIILIGFKKDLLSNWGCNINGTAIIKDFNWDKNTLFKSEQVFAHKWPTLDPFSENSVRPSPTKFPVELTVEYWFKKNDVDKHPNSKHFFTPRAGLAKFKLIDEGDDLKKSYKRLHRWRYSPTAAYGNNEVHLHPYKARRISVAEALAIQSLPKEFEIPSNISLTDMFKTIGNGVPFLAAKGLAQNIADFIFEHQPKDLKKSNGKINRKQHSGIYQPA